MDVVGSCVRIRCNLDRESLHSKFTCSSMYRKSLYTPPVSPFDWLDQLHVHHACSHEDRRARFFQGTQAFSRFPGSKQSLHGARMERSSPEQDLKAPAPGYRVI
jgi:hypothetical protein